MSKLFNSLSEEFKKMKNTFKLQDNTTMNDLASFDEIMEYLRKKHRIINLLLGNGFSISYKPDIFSYNALSKFIEETDNVQLKKLFEIVKTKNFEEILDRLTVCYEFLITFGVKKEILDIIQKAENDLKNSLIDAIKNMHPEHVFTIPDAEQNNCLTFLKIFLDSGGEIFSSNYDLLLYWVLMRSKLQEQDAIGDGFGRYKEGEGDDVTLSRLLWGKNCERQKIHYIHGALFLFDDGIDIIKEEYDGEFLLNNIRKRIDNRQYPIFVAAGNAEQKLRHILHNKYLIFCYDKLSSVCGSIVTHGLSFGVNDTHIIDALNKAHAQQDQNKKLRSVYIGVYTERDLEHIKTFVVRHFSKTLKINVYDARTAIIWR